MARLVVLAHVGILWARVVARACERDMEELDQYWLSIDPGVEYYAYSKWRLGQIEWTDVYRFDEPWECNSDLLAVVERPRIMPGRKVRSKDVEGVLISFGRLQERYPRMVELGPHSVPEKIWHSRIKNLLTPQELAIVEKQPKSVQKHTVDAVGLGLRYQGRL